ncbi:MAG: FAD-dependent monooxygenase [Candidatus Thermoplasmatota archaeon]
MKNNYDIVVVGAGPAGCMFINCLKNNYDVLLIERQKLPATKICGGLLTEESIDFLSQHHLSIPSYVFSHPKKLKKAYVNLDKGIEKEQGIVYNIDRNQFNHWMYHLVENKIDVAEHMSIKKITTTNEKNSLQVYDHTHGENKEITCTYLIGADGVLSRVRKELQFPPVNKYLAVQDYGTSQPEIDRLCLLYSKAFIDHFIWVMPKGKYTIVGLPFHYDYGKTIDMKKVDTARQIVEHYTGIKIQSGFRNGFLVSIPQSLNELCLGKQKSILIGEAAGWISPRSGDGISFALRSAENCAQAFNESSTNILQIYTQKSKDLKEEFHEKLESFLKIQQKIKEYKKRHNL